MTLSKLTTKPAVRRVRSRATWATALLALFLSGMLLTLVSGATAAATALDLGSATSFAVLAGTPNITDVPTSVITGDVGLSPAAGSAIGVSCAEVTGTIYSVDSSGPPCRVTDAPLLTTAKTNLTAAYVIAAAETPSTALAGADNQLGGQNLGPGVYNFGNATTANLTGNLILTGNASDVWVFQVADTLVTASSSSITFAGGAQACNVFWEVGSTATLGTNSVFAGTIMALTDIHVTTGVTIDGRVLARNGAVTLDSDTIKRSDCTTPSSTSTTTSATTTDATTTDTTPTSTTTVAAETTTVVAAIPVVVTPATTPKATTTVRAPATLTVTTATKAAVKIATRTRVASRVAATGAASRAAAARAAAARATAARAVAARATAARATAARAAEVKATAARRADARRKAAVAAARKTKARLAAVARGHARPALSTVGFTG